MVNKATSIVRKVISRSVFGVVTVIGSPSQAVLPPTISTTQSPDIPELVQLLFPPEGIDGSCSYRRPMRRGESLAAYLLDVSTPGQVTDLDCVLEGEPDRAVAAGTGSAYAYANAFLIVREMPVPASATLEQMLERTKLGQQRPTGEILYFLSAAAFNDGQIDCAQALGWPPSISAFSAPLSASIRTR